MEVGGFGELEEGLKEGVDVVEGRRSWPRVMWVMFW